MIRFILFLFLGGFMICCQTKSKETIREDTSEINNNAIDSIIKDTLSVSKEFILGKFDYRKDSTFTKISAEHSSKVIYLKGKAYEAFLRMLDSAKKDSIHLKIISGTRNFYEQKAIWERKWEKYKILQPIDRAKKILEYSSMPSSSRHHWGTDIDLNSLNNSYFNSGKGLKEYEWLRNHANDFGFYQVYTDKIDGRTGYNLEKWHWSYLPLASQYLEYYNTNISAENISGFKGSELASKLYIIENYVNGISEKAKKINQ